MFMNKTQDTSTRTTHAEAILGPELVGRLAETKVLLVGAGGIGCELLKNIVLTGFGHITLLDLDTIDLSNLNRQFLFRKKDVKNSKAMVASATAAPFNPSVHIHPIHANIKEPQFDVTWFKGFDLVLNALDNLDARRHVNKMCIAAGVPLVESGTAGYLGQVQPILKDQTECFDCIPKPTPKTFPVCTIRSTPSQPIHCIVWAKSYLVPQLFGEDEEDQGSSELDEAEKAGENAEEIATLRKEAQAFKVVRTALRAPASTSGDAARMVFEKIFRSDILNLLSMSDMWRAPGRTPPVPLDYDTILDGTFVLRGRLASVPPPPAAASMSAKAASVASPSKGTSVANGHASTSSAANGENSTSAVAGAGLKDQRALSLQDSLKLFVSSTDRLAQRLRAGEETISFDKDDDDTLDFVTAASNLRSAAYDIGGKTRWEVKEMAGNIIPAIATTNAIIAGLIVLQALHLLRKSHDKLKNVHLQFKPAVPLSTIGISTPNTGCGVCRDTYVEVQLDPARVTLGELVDGLLGEGAEGGEGGEDGEGTGKRDVSVYEDKRVLLDPDFDDNAESTLESLGVARGKFITIVDEDGEWGTISAAIGMLPPNHPEDGSALILPTPLPLPPHIIKPRPALDSGESTPVAMSTSSSSMKRAAPDDDDEDIIMDGQPAAKRARTDGVANNGASTSAGAGASVSAGKAKRPNEAPVVNMASPSKKRRLEEDGLLLLEHADDKMEDEVIEID